MRLTCPCAVRDKNFSTFPTHIFTCLAMPYEHDLSTLEFYFLEYRGRKNYNDSYIFLDVVHNRLTFSFTNILVYFYVFTLV